MRIVSIISALLKFRMIGLNIKKTSVQSEPIKKNIYNCPSNEEGARKKCFGGSARFRMIHLRLVGNGHELLQVSY